MMQLCITYFACTLIRQGLCVLSKIYINSCVNFTPEGGSLGYVSNNTAVRGHYKLGVKIQTSRSKEEDNEGGKTLESSVCKQTKYHLKSPTAFLYCTIMIGKTRLIALYTCIVYE